MPIAHLLELWKGIEVEPMETEVSSGGGGCGRPQRCCQPPLSRRGNHLGAAPNLAKWGAVRFPRPLRSLLRAGREARLGNLLPHTRSGLERGCPRPAPVPLRSPAGCGGRCGLPCRPLLHRVWVGTVLLGFGEAVREGACKTDGNLQSRLSRT